MNVLAAAKVITNQVLTEEEVLNMLPEIAYKYANGLHRKLFGNKNVYTFEDIAHYYMHAFIKNNNAKTYIDYCKGADIRGEHFLSLNRYVYKQLSSYALKLRRAHKHLDFEVVSTSTPASRHAYKYNGEEGAFDILDVTPSGSSAIEDVITQEILDRVLDCVKDKSLRCATAFTLQATKETYKATRKDFIKLLMKGYTKAEIAKLYNITQQGVFYIIKNILDSVSKPVKIELMGYLTA